MASPPSADETIAASVLDTIGATPLVRLNRLPAEAGCRAEILVKIEAANPGGSLKDRIAKAMVERAESSGRLGPGRRLIEASSGNTAISLAIVAAAKGLALTLVMPEDAPPERRKLCRFYGATVELTPAALGMSGALARARELAQGEPNAVLLDQFSDPANPAAHAATTAEEIWRACAGRLDAVVAGVGTGGSLSGIAHTLKPRAPGLAAIAVEPVDSPVLSGGLPGLHKIQGLGPGFVPDTLDRDMIDEIIAVRNVAAFATARRAARLEGLGCGISSGAALAAALEVGARSAFAGKRIVVLCPSAAERYMTSELFHDL